VWDKVLPRAFNPDEVTKFLRQVFKLLAALQGECETLKVLIEQLETHHHVTGDMIFGLAEQSPQEESTTEPDEPAAEPEEPTAD
jgi:cell division septum initiation protein DivIVA